MSDLILVRCLKLDYGMRAAQSADPVLGNAQICAVQSLDMWLVEVIL